MATVYIAPTAQGTGDGSSAANAYAYSSLSTAETQAEPGGTILFTDGDYSLTGTTIWDGVGTSGNNITYKSLNSQGAVIKNSVGGTLRQLSVGSTGNTSTINVQNFKFIDINFYFYNQGAGEISGNLITTSTAIALPTNAFLRVTGSGTTKLLNNSIQIQYASGNYVERETSRLAEFSGNTIYISSLNGKTGPVYYTYSTSTDLRSCPIVKNNIFATDDTTGNVLETQNSFSGSFNNCCFHQFDDSNNGSGGTNNKFADPQFVDSANGDLRLRPSSPCINAGTAS